ncbi:MAG: amino acid adenylation domain-containing protein [Bacteroidetes bacterium]|nr:amino acid adenylation domain-containing protein [Bacteroidota bacterium]
MENSVDKKLAKGETELLVHDLFEQQAAIGPDAIALRFGNEQRTYKQLDQQADILSNLILKNSHSSSIVGISTSRTIEMVIGVLAILKSGKAYLPLDPAYPKERLQQIVSDSGIDCCLSPDAESSFFGSFGVTVIATDKKNEAAEKILHTIKSSLAYVLYTSGSTGKPKGVCMGHRPLVNLLQWQKKHSKAKAGTKTLQFAPLSFDVSFQELFATLSTGGELVLIEDDMRLDPQNLLHFIQEQNINRIFLPFVALQFLTETADATKFYPTSLEEVMTAGEQLKITPQVVRFFQALPKTILYNQYGPTECHVVTELKLEGDPQQWPALPSIGKAIDNTEMLILDAELNKLPAGEIGELCISGECLAEGYLNRPELTAEKFVTIKSSSGDLRIYRTGDEARYLPDGNIEFLGRKDDQVKIRGFRVELGEIEVLLSKQNGIKQAVVVAREDVPGNKRLVAYLISSGGKKDITPLRRAVEKQLPDYMMPAAFMWMEDFPKTTSGKVDKKALPKPEIKRPTISVLYKAPATESEILIANLWASLLQLDKVGVHDNFFELGGNSLLALKTVATLKQQHGHTLPITKLYQYPTAGGIATFMDGGKKIISKTKNKNRRKDIQNGDVAVIGMAGRFPGANTIDELWNILKEGRETISFFTKEELDPFIPFETKNDPDYVRARGIIDHPGEFDAAFFGINPKLAELMDPQQRIFLEIAWEALEGAGYIPSKYAGSIGVFAGSGNNTYYLNNVLSNKNLVDRMGSFQVMTFNEKDYVASRTAYELSLKGPAVSVYSACSTSLLAIAQAVESLRNGKCDVALAGGVAITVPIRSGHIYQEGAMLSHDGHCRSFDAEAKGTVFSDGAGVVLLKNREDAERDGDIIYAIIKGVGINNDGGGKGSFTAPSAEGQAGAISMAIEDAGIPASSISYVEAHGTATPLGDPIEIEGLNIAFGSQEKNQYCAIGSIKSNMGHLTAASGVAGFIKTTLALYHQQIPASINYKNPNPNIDFKNSPFYVNDKLRAWEAEDKRRAGVSSFGVGGTNLHVVLEEYLAKEQKSSSSRPVQLINWSAKTVSSRDAYAKKLSGLIEKNHDINLSDIAYHLQTGREDFSSRRFVIASERNELIEKLNASSVSPAESKQLQESWNEIVFMFPGQGSQSVNMGRDLYEHEPVFRDAVDMCASILEEYMGEDILDIIYPKNNSKGSEDKINNTYYTQPAMFMIEYAMAKLWMSWGIQPMAFIGHSIGEFVAAHLAGVFSLEDGLKLISTRGRMMGELPRGSMLAVRADYEKIADMLPADLSVAALNSPGSCVIAGPVESADKFSKYLDEKGISSKLLHTSHAFHSSMMDTIVAPFEQVVRSVKLSLPRIPIVSTVTGTWMTDADATNPAYWAGHLRSTVRFSDAVKTLLEEENKIFLEAGPRNVTTTLVRQQAGKKSIATIASLDIAEGSSDYYSLMKAVGQLWLHGVQLDWKAFYGEEKRAKLSLPSYAFDRTRLWVDPAVNSQAGIAAVLNTPSVHNATNNNELIVNMSPQNIIMRKSALIDKVKNMLEDASGIEMEGVTPDMGFMEIGLDSLLLTQIALNLKKEFGLPITFRQLTEEYNSLDLLADFLDANLPKEQMQPQPVAIMPQQPALQMQQSAAMPAGNTVIGLISQQIQLLAQQVALLQGSPAAAAQPVAQNIIPNAAPVSTPASSTGKTAEAGLSAEELVELKKPFGATARIERQSSKLSQKQQAFIDDLIKRYNQKTIGSKNYTQEHRAYMADPRVVSGFKPQTKDIVYSLVVNKSKGSRLWDIDGNEYIDVLNGFGSSMFGYQPDFIVKAMHEQIANGYEVGPQHELAGPVCKLICEFTGADRAALCNTGSEAVLGAMRIARTVTGRSTIVAFTGSYHGIVDEVIVRGTKKLKSFPAAPGIMPEAVQNMLILDYGTEESLKIIRERAHEFAAVLVEPVQSRRPEFQPVEFLKELRQITEKSGTALIFDEVITGFRMHPGGAQALFGVKADLGTYGKVVGAGISIGVIAGKKQFMDALDGGFWQYGDDSIPPSGVTYFAGTFVRHPLALASSKASLEYMKAKGSALQQGINDMTKRLADALNAICVQTGLPGYVAQFGSLWKLKWKEEIPYTELLFTLMRDKGIHIQDGFPCFLTEAHTNKDVDIVVEKFLESVNEMIEAGFFPSAKETKGDNNKNLIKEEPPVPGAKLGRDKEGNPAWFITDPNRPGKYLQLN